MGIFGGKAASTGPTAIDLANMDPARDAEKHLEGASNVENPNTLADHGDGHIVDPAMERRVIRKMDLRLVPLVSALCKLMWNLCSNFG